MILAQVDLDIEHAMQMKAKSDLITKKKKFQDETMVVFRAFREYVKEQAEYEATAYIKCLGDVEREL